jgi:hypothetical protein
VESRGPDVPGSGEGPVAGSCVHGNEPSSFVKSDFLN